MISFAPMSRLLIFVSGQPTTDVKFCISDRLASDLCFSMVNHNGSVLQVVHVVLPASVFVQDGQPQLFNTFNYIRIVRWSRFCFLGCDTTSVELFTPGWLDSILRSKDGAEHVLKLTSLTGNLFIFCFEMVHHIIESGVVL